MWTLPRPRRSGSTTPLVSVILIALWLLALRVHNAYDPRLFGHGPEEYRAVATATREAVRDPRHRQLPVQAGAGPWLPARRAPVRVGRALRLPVDLAALARRPARRRTALRRDDRRRRPRPPRRPDRRPAQRARGRLHGGRRVLLRRHRPDRGRTDRRHRAPGGRGRRAARGRRRRVLGLLAARLGGAAPPGLGARGHRHRPGPRARDDPGRRTTDPHPARSPGCRCSTSRPRRSRVPKRAVKSTFDVVGALIIGIILSPLLLVVAVLVARDGGGRVLQADPGRPGRHAVPHVEVPLDGAGRRQDRPRRAPTTAPVRSTS